MKTSFTWNGSNFSIELGLCECAGWGWGGVFTLFFLASIICLFCSFLVTYNVSNNERDMTNMFASFATKSSNKTKLLTHSCTSEKVFLFCRFVAIRPDFIITHSHTRRHILGKAKQNWTVESLKNYCQEWCKHHILDEIIRTKKTIILMYVGGRDILLF